MARITVEDCLENVDNRFELVMLATKRARQLALNGADPFLDWENDKATVMALREIANGDINYENVDLQARTTEDGDGEQLTDEVSVEQALQEALAEADQQKSTSSAQTILGDLPATPPAGIDE